MSHISRRGLILGGIAAFSVPHFATAQTPFASLSQTLIAPVTAFGVVPDVQQDQSQKLQKAIDEASQRRVALALPAGVYRVSALNLRPHTTLIGSGSETIMRFTGDKALISATKAPHVRLEHLMFDGANIALKSQQADALIRFESCASLLMTRVHVKGIRGGHAIVLRECDGYITQCILKEGTQAAILSANARGLTLTHNTITDFSDNGILIWRNATGHDGSMISDNRISRIKNISGGSGQWGNGINIFRADGVSVQGNHIEDCAYSAIRANASSTSQMSGNQIRRIGEVALYAELTLGNSSHAGLKSESHIITGNTIDHAATGISVTNMDQGGRLAIVHGNIVRNLTRREHEPMDKRGEGIHVEADCIVTNNIIENAATCGLLLGWGKYMREVIASHNLIRASRVGIAITHDTRAGQTLVSHNMISGHTDGAIRLSDHGKSVGDDLTKPQAAVPHYITLDQNKVVN